MAKVDPELRRYHATKHLGTELQCQEIARTGDRCTKHVISVQAGKDKFYGTRCPKHAGAAEKRRLVQQLREVKLRNVAKKVGTPVEIDPTEAMIQQVWEAAGNVAYYREKVRMLQVPLDLDPRTLYPTLFEEQIVVSVNGSGSDDHTRQIASDLEEIAREAPPGSPSLYGPDHLGDLAPHVLLKFYNDERDRLVRYIKTCVELGIQERHQRLAENQMKLMAHILLKVLNHPGLGLVAEQVEFARKSLATLFREYESQMRGRVAALNAGAEEQAS